VGLGLDVAVSYLYLNHFWNSHMPLVMFVQHFSSVKDWTGWVVGIILENIMS